MNNESKEFLLELLKTPSPSGREQEIQKKYANYIKDYADKIEVDHAGNVIGRRRGPPLAHTGRTTVRVSYERRPCGISHPGADPRKNIGGTELY